MIGIDVENSAILAFITRLIELQADILLDVRHESKPEFKCKDKLTSKSRK